MANELPNIDINNIVTDLNNKMDRDGVNSSCPVVISRTANSNGGITEIWSDGYCVQTGTTTGIGGGDSETVNLTTSFKDTTFKTFISGIGTYTATGEANCIISSKTVSSFTLFSGYNGTKTFDWRAEGYIR